jgi:hypothetical protein
MEVKWHPIKSEKDLPPLNKWVLVTSGGKVDVSRWLRRGNGDVEWWWYPKPSA